ncbi:MAG TPA: ribonuclease III [Saprospiraceae bacterium]|nr:ribonuclease III [Saprospiraceae bacterium]HMT71538.1 ribonuclease III [Saprospiraceae bacterium]HQV67982.1 ribonuclease III [Saprospiraceae bacterium]HQV97527.1 ribonuclease III [Saprospiraceae bacterium]HRG42299.1 ribonuclease III [Saprospiraceae bacterium]
MDIVRRFYNLYFSDDKELTMRLRPILGFTPARLNLFKTAFYHKSMTNETPGKATNERLEYLGDAILSTIVAEYLFKKYPNKDEGFLTKMRSKIVKRQTLNEIADNMGLDVILAEYSMGKMSNSMLGNALEALVGAIYIEFGYEKTKTYVIKNILMKYLNINDLETRDDNHKSQLLEWCQKNGKDINFATLSKFKLDKRDCFKVAIVIDGVEISTAEDFNKKSAEQTAANRAIEKLMIQNTLT